MVSSPRSFIEHVGHVLFPRGPKDLTDISRCPACFVALPSSSVCASCGLDMNHPDAALLREDSLNAAALMDARLELIGKIRFETAAEHARNGAARLEAERRAAASVSQRSSRLVALPEPAPVTGPGVVEHARVPNATGKEDTARTAGIRTETPPARARPARTHSGIQVLLLVVGVSLLSVGAIFFLIYAFLTFGLIWRSAIIASITIASIVAASKMKQRGLSATAEALSALAVVFVILDIYALRANDLLVVGDAEGRLYWGGALVISSLGFMLWHRASGLRLINVVGFVLFPPAAALLAAGIAADQNYESATLLTVAAFAAASLIHAIAAHGSYSATVERVVCVIYAMLALGSGLVSGALESAFSNNSAVGIWMLILAALAASHSAAIRQPGLSTAIRYAFATASGLLLGTAIWITLADTARANAGLETNPSIVVAIIASLTIAALLVEASGRRLSLPARTATFWGSVGVWVVTAIAAIIPLSQSIIAATQYADQQLLRRTTLGNTAYDILDRGWPQLALLTVPVAMAVLWWLTGQLRSRIHIVLASAGVALSLAAPLTGTLMSTVITWLALATAALVIIAVDKQRRGPRRTHLTVAAGGLLPLLLAYTSSWSSHETWAFTSIATAVLLVAVRYLVSQPIVRAALIAAATLVLLFAAGGVGEQLQFSLTDKDPNPLESWLTIALATVALLAFSLWRENFTLQPLERRTLWWISLSGTALAGTTLWVASVGGAPALSAPLALDIHLISLFVAVALVAVLGIAMVGRTMHDHRAARYAAAALLAPTIVWALDSAGRAIGLADIVIDLAPATASVLVGALSMALRVRGEHTRVRRISEVSALTIAGLTAASAVLQPQDSHWLIALFVSITLLLASVARDGVFGSTSPRRHIVWGAVAFATWALWLRLDQTRVDALEAYVLPLAAVVLAIAVFTARAELRDSRLKSAPLIALAALLIAILPLSLNAASGNGLRTLVIAGLCGALLLTASFVDPREKLVDFWGVAIIASGAGLVVSTASRALIMATESRSALPELDSWLLGAVAVLALASFGLASTTFSREAANARWAVTSTTLLGTAIVLLYVVETIVLFEATGDNRPLDSIRIVVLVALGGALLLMKTRPSARPLTRGISNLAFILASFVGVIAYLGDLIRPFEWVTVILGVALLAQGALHMIRNSDARSFPSLSAGLLVTLLPTLLATFINSDNADTQWRILALGVACIVAIVAGTWLKLQAPLVIGTIVVLIHAAHTFAPALVTFYQLTDWWVWAVVGGAIVLFLGITLERRIRDLKVLNARFSSLR
ncbi:SCO7613 C-terminal domain-containing membrane protein [Rhodoglobus aureus]|uniref:DUF2157 domain-containing protein n=1 Tax=Rhodoglobus aureus TaxID=191497 RepID=A0ABN1VCZ6_9MICO